MFIYLSTELVDAPPWVALPYFTISLSLNIILTLMIVIRLILRARETRAALGITGIGGLSKAIVTMLVESSTLFAVSSLLVLGPWSARSGVVNIFFPVLSENQVRASPRQRSSDMPFNATLYWTGHCFTAHHQTSRK